MHRAWRSPPDVPHLHHHQLRHQRCCLHAAGHQWSPNTVDRNWISLFLAVSRDFPPSRHPTCRKVLDNHGDGDRRAAAKEAEGRAEEAEEHEEVAVSSVPTSLRAARAAAQSAVGCTCRWRCVHYEGTHSERCWCVKTVGVGRLEEWRVCLCVCMIVRVYDVRVCGAAMEIRGVAQQLCQKLLGVDSRLIRRRALVVEPSFLFVLFLSGRLLAGAADEQQQPAGPHGMQCAGG